MICRKSWITSLSSFLNGYPWTDFRWTFQRLTLLFSNQKINLRFVLPFWLIRRQLMKWTVKYLGVLIDSQLTFKNHIDELTKKISRAIGVLYKLRPYVNTKILTNVYYAIIYPFLLYGITIWGNASLNLITPIHILQKKFVRLATFNDSYSEQHGPLVHTPPLFYELKLLTIFDVFKLQAGKFVYESINGIGPSSLSI